MKLEVGMYVRTKNGMIAKIIDKRDVSGSLHREEIVFILDNGNKLALHSQKVIKASFNIIDLIEVGDFITYKSGNCYTNYPCRVYGTSNEDGETTLMIDGNRLKDIIITSIVTKEQFKANEYKV